jgi:G3E family GTPase
LPVNYYCRVQTPVHIISGFLGSGKTTAILKMLSNRKTDLPWAVIINEFGKVSIDGQTLRSGGGSAQIFEVSGGCICCTAAVYFRENLEKIAGSGQYDRILVEPSGLGGIDMVSEIAGQMPGLQLMPVICLVDITLVENPRLQINPVYKAQISKADAIVFSKCDLVESIDRQNALVAGFMSRFPFAQCFEPGTEPHAVLTDSLAWVKPHNRFRYLSIAESSFSKENFREFTFTFDPEITVDEAKLIGFLSENPAILRAKGYVCTPGGWKLFNYTLSDCNFEPCTVMKMSKIVVITGESEEIPAVLQDTEHFCQTIKQ